MTKFLLKDIVDDTRVDDIVGEDVIVNNILVLIPLFAFIYGIDHRILKLFNFDHSIFLYLRSDENEVETKILINFLIIL